MSIYDISVIVMFSSAALGLAGCMLESATDYDKLPKLVACAVGIVAWGCLFLAVTSLSIVIWSM